MKLTIHAVLLLSLLTLALEVNASCRALNPEKLVSEYKHIYVGFVTDAYFSEEEGLKCGVVIGNVTPVETLKGDPSLVPTVKQSIWSCEGMSIAGKSDLFPVGHFVIVFSNGEVPRLANTCGPTQKITYMEGKTCFVDKYRRELNLYHSDTEGCLEEKERAELRCKQIDEREGAEVCITNR